MTDRPHDPEHHRKRARTAPRPARRLRRYRDTFLLYGIRGAGTSAGASAIAVLAWWARHRG